ncbi:MAG: universal stress protein [Burkholderiales bacterium]|nr:universal stress protein [Burkholderiales bacterium]
MYKHILVPTDGSVLSDKAVEAAIKLAKLAGARITAFHAVEPYPLQGAYAAEASGVAELQPEIFAQRSEEYAKRVLDAVAAAAAAENVQCTTAYVTGNSASQAIVEKAGEEKCDLIVMASHGRRGLEGFLLGSETQKVLTHSSIPVLVYR